MTDIVRLEVPTKADCEVVGPCFEHWRAMPWAARTRYIIEVWPATPDGVVAVLQLLNLRAISNFIVPVLKENSLDFSLGRTREVIGSHQEHYRAR